MGDGRSASWLARTAMLALSPLVLGATGLTSSPDGRLLAWSADTSGAERFTLRIRDLATGRDIETVSEVVNGVAKHRLFIWIA